MPKDPSAKLTSASGTSSPSALALKRNQACHSCRRRKLKCDAKRPCSTCVRSLAHAKAHPQPGVVLPDEPNCTYDEGAKGAPEQPKTRYEKLDNRLRDLEAILLTEKAAASPSNSSVDNNNAMVLDYSSILTDSALASPAGTPGDSPAGDSSVHSGHRSSTAPTSTTTSPQLHPNAQLGVMWPAWPRDLPSPDLLRHLVESFFLFHPHANRLFHQSTFMASLTFPPAHPSFPCTAVLHALCGVGSMYTGVVYKLPGRGLMPFGDAFQQAYKDKSYMESFAEMHIKHAKAQVEENIAHGRSLLQSQQALIIVAWWYWCHARWVELYMLVAQIMRACLPLGLHASDLFKPINEGIGAPSILPPPMDDTEAELRRNIFWLAYCLERLSGCGNGWPLALDDQDVSQFLPVSAMNFALGISWPPASDREHAWGKDVLLTHNIDQVDGFVLFVKGCMLLSRVKTFNLRYALKKHNQDHSVTYVPSLDKLWECALTDNEVYLGSLDPRRTSAFLELQHLAEDFKPSFPQHLRDPMASGNIDSYLYVASLMPHVALILLHDPHAHIEENTCRSAVNLLQASRSILELLYLAETTTSHDLSLLDYFCSFAWFMAGRSLTRFWQVAIQAKASEEVDNFRREVEYIAAALRKAGRRVPLAQRYGAMLSDNAFKLCGTRVTGEITP